MSKVVPLVSSVPISSPDGVMPEFEFQIMISWLMFCLTAGSFATAQSENAML